MGVAIGIGGRLGSRGRAIVEANEVSCTIGGRARVLRHVASGGCTVAVRSMVKGAIVLQPCGLVRHLIYIISLLDKQNNVKKRPEPVAKSPCHRSKINTQQDAGSGRTAGAVTHLSLSHAPEQQ